MSTPDTAPVEAAGALDLLLTDAALGVRRRFLPGRSTAQFLGALARRPRPTAERAADLVAELGRIAVGASTLAPSSRDRRFADPAWTANPVLRRVVQAYLAGARTADGVPADAYRVGTDLACTPGEVVLRTPVFELIQYTPSTETVHATPLVMVPPTINKYYVMDLAPGRSMIEYFVGQGQQVFVLSWRNPDTGHREWGTDVYGAAIAEALDAACAITGVDRAHLLGVCSGGILASMVAGHLAATGRDRLASLTLLVTMLDQERAGTTGALVDETTARAAIAASRARGHLDGRALAEVFAWLRPGDLIWNYWVNNYLAGRTPPAFDILFWNADTTRMTAALHRDFVTAGLDNALTRPGDAAMLGTGIDLGAVTVDSYVVAGSADHICPWRTCYASTRLLGGTSRFVLSTNGHIAALVNPPGNPKSGYQVGPDDAADPDAWAAGARTEQGSWWPDYTRWLAQRSGPRVAAPATSGGPAHRPIEPAPGRYVLDT